MEIGRRLFSLLNMGKFKSIASIELTGQGYHAKSGTIPDNIGEIIVIIGELAGVSSNNYIKIWGTNFFRRESSSAIDSLHVINLNDEYLFYGSEIPYQNSTTYLRQANYTDNTWSISIYSSNASYTTRIYLYGR